MMARIVFMGTPQFAVPALEVLDEHHEVVGVVTQPDRRAGRGRKVVPSPVKEAALARGLPIFQPANLQSVDALDHLAGWRPEVIVVFAFGQLLPRPVLDLPPYGCLNIHPSLLPRYRGPAPVAAAVLAGDRVTGVTIMRMDEGLDTGPILAQAEHPIAADDTTGSLTAKLAEQGGQLLIDTLAGWLAGEIQAQPQDEALVTYCHHLKKGNGLLDWSQPAEYIDRQVRAYDPWPGTYTTWEGRRLKVLRAGPVPDWQGEGAPGQVVALPSGPGVVTGEGLLELLEVQLAGKKPVAGGLFAQGQKDLIGSLLAT
jgi:methionyl-tRNA formyltransferase